MNFLYIRNKSNKLLNELNGGKVIKQRNLSFINSIADKVITYEVSYFKNIYSFYFHALFGFTNGFSFFDNYKLKKIIKKNNITDIFIDSSSIGSFSTNILKKYKTYVFFHNVEINYYKSAHYYKNTLKKFLYSIYLKDIYRNEKRICKYSKKIITLNNRDSKELERIYGRKADLNWPTTFKDNFDGNFKYNNSKYLLFVGFDFFGNTDGLFWFIENCMPYIDYKLVIVGSGMDKYKNKYSNPNINFLGYVDDLSEYYYNADAVVLPIKSGSGMKTKTCEALMYGKQIFGTSEAFEGYDNISMTSCIICNKAEDFIDILNNYISQNKFVKFHSSCRKEFLENYEEKKCNLRIEKYFNND